jgi:flagellar biosynthetic protein FlhB
MAEYSAADKTEKATEHKRRRAREEGSVARSMDLNSVAVLFAGVMALQFIAGKMLFRITGLFHYVYQDLTKISITPLSLPSQVLGIIKLMIPILAPVLLLVMAAGLAINFAQTGIVISAKPLIPKPNRISPLKGLKNLFSSRSLVELIKGVLKMLLVGWIGYSIINRNIQDFWLLSGMEMGAIIVFMGRIMLEIYIKIGVVLIVLAAADFLYQKWNYEKNLRMTKQEVKDEAKQYENPEIKGRIRSIQRQLARKRMMAAVPKATVVVTNPTFIAVALKYSMQDKYGAPVVVAKGIRKIAERIREIAQQNRVPIIENKPLARSLYDSLEVGQEIPEAFYQAVAEILAQVFKMKQQVA